MSLVDVVMTVEKSGGAGRGRMEGRCGRYAYLMGTHQLKTIGD